MPYHSVPNFNTPRVTLISVSKQISAQHASPRSDNAADSLANVKHSGGMQEKQDGEGDHSLFVCDPPASCLNQ